MFFHPPHQTDDKNFYSILGVTPTATESEIKSAYRKLSLKYHPDRNKSSDAQKMFQELSDAYETLSDPNKKRQYDMQQNGGGGAEINDFFNMMFSQGAFGPPGRGPQHFHAAGPRIHIFNGAPGAGGLEDFFHQPQKPERIQKQINITIEQAYHGCNIPIEIERMVIRGEERSKENETIYVNIPQGIDTNETINLHDKGHCINDTIRGDVRLIIQVINNSSFQRNGLELFYKKTISLKEALLGFTFDLHHLNGKIFTFSNFGSIIQPNFKRRLQDLGMIRENNRGNLWIEFNIQFPETLTEQQMNSLKEII